MTPVATPNPPVSSLLFLPFCARQGDISTWEFQHPFVSDGYVVATNCHAAIRVPAALVANADMFVARDSARRSPDIVALIGAIDTDSAAIQPIELPPLPAPEPCRVCGGQATHRCMSCNGEGSFEHYGHDYPCAHCYGSGQVAAEDNHAGVAELCRACDGSNDELSLSGCDVGDGHFALRYLRLLSTLQELRIKPRGDRLGAYFTFAHGDGVLMPMRRQAPGAAS